MLCGYVEEGAGGSRKHFVIEETNPQFGWLDMMPDFERAR